MTTTRTLSLLLSLLLLLALPAAANNHPNVARGFDPEKAYAIDEVGAINLFNGSLTVPIPLGRTFQAGPDISYGFTLFYAGNNWSTEMRSEVVRGANGEPVKVCQDASRYRLVTCGILEMEMGWTWPARGSNAGFGWRLHFGEVTANPVHPPAEFTYEAPDGSSHRFFKTLHHNHAPEAAARETHVFYTRDGSYLRAQYLDVDDDQKPDQIVIEFPGGVKHYFDRPVTAGPKMVRKIEDAYGNSVDFNYDATGADRPAELASAATVWKIEDSYGRKHWIALEQGPSYHEDDLKTLVSHQVVAAAMIQGPDKPNGTKQWGMWTFEYDGETPGSDGVVPWARVTRPNPGFPDHYDAPSHLSLALLKKVHQPDGTNYEFDYVRTPDGWIWDEWYAEPGSTPDGSPPDSTSTGILKSVVLPSGGAVRWEYGIIPFPPSSLAMSNHKNQPGVSTTLSVLERRTYAGGNQAVSRRTFTWHTDNPGGTDQMDLSWRPLEKHVTVEDFEGQNGPRLRKTRHFFNVCSTRHCADGAVKGEYSLPFTKKDQQYNRLADRGQGRFLSSITYGPDWTTPLTLTYVGYEADYDLSLTQIGEFDYNRRIVSQRTADWINGAVANCVNDKFSEFDGLGHYRVSTRTTTCAEAAGDPSRVTTTLYNATDDDGGAVSLETADWPWPDHDLPPVDSPWIIGTYSLQSVREGNKSETSLFHFQTATGRLLRKRTLAGADIGTTDLLTGYDYLTSDKGLVSSEKYYGGDAAGSGVPIGRLDQLSLANVRPELTVLHEYENGVLARSRHEDSSTSLVLYDVDGDVDSTGAVKASRDVSGVLSTFTYDVMGRLTAISSAGRAYIEYAWQPASRRVTATTYDNSGKSKLLGRSTYDYDHFGRLSVIRQLQHDNLDSRQEHGYDALGRRVTTSVLGRAATLPVTRHTFDVLGRVLSIVAPDGTTSASFEYDGSRRKTRTQWIANGGADPVPSVTAEELDGFGRLVRVEEQSGDAGATVGTDYTYSVGDRLATVSTTAQGVTQLRSFTFDGRGFLTSETHPESGTTNYRYDSRGHLIFKQAADPRFNLTFTYDALERLRTVSETDPANPSQLRTLKDFRYAATQTVGEKGKLKEAIRHNYPVHDQPSSLDVNRDPVVVTETYAYDSAGRRKERETKIESAGTVKVFTQGATYTELDQPATVTYPKCLGCGLPPFGLDSVTLDYTRGRLNRVEGRIGASVHGIVDQVDYADNGTWSRRRHANGVVDVQARDPFGIARPRSIGVERCSVIAEQPKDMEGVSGGTVTFTVIPSRADVKYAWYAGKRGDTSKAIANYTNALTVDVATAEPQYWCRVTTTDGTCSQDSHAVSVLVCAPPVITSPDTATQYVQVAAGTTRTYAVTATASAPTYRWFRIVNGGPETLIGNGSPRIDVTFAAGGEKVDIIAEVSSACGMVRRIVAKVDVTNDWPCAGELIAQVADRYFTINPDEPNLIDVTARLVTPAGRQPGESPYTVTYSFKWYQDGHLAQDNTTRPSESSSQFYFRFTNQSFVRVDAQLNCTNRATLAESESPVFSSRGYGVMWDHCPVPEIFLNPTDVVMPEGQSITLGADVPYPDGTYQWYVGESGNTAEKAPNGTVKDLVVTRPGAYWLRVSTDCGTHSDSPTVTVSTSSCTPIRITDEPDDASIAAAAPVALTVRAASKPSPNYYLWYQSNGVGEQPVRDSLGRSSITVAPLRTTDYYAKITSDCSSARSRVARVHVKSCSAITVNLQPADKTLMEGQPLELTMDAASAEPLRYRWYRGEAGDISSPIEDVDGDGDDDGSWRTLYLSDPASGRYWVRLSFDEAPGTPEKCAIDSRTVTVKVCRRPVVTNPLPADYVNTVPRLRRVLNFGVTGEDLSYEWFEGPLNDESRRLRSTSSAVAVYPDATTTYWVRVRSRNCPATATDKEVKAVTTVSVCPDFAGSPTVSKPVVNSGETVTLKATLRDGADRLEWFMVMPAGTEPQKIATVTAPDLTFTSPPITTPATFFARAWSGTCHVDSRNVSVDVCSGNSVRLGYNKTQIESGEQTTLTAFPSGEAGTTTWQWYQGTVKGDVAGSTLFHTSSNAVDVRPTVTTSYWVRMTRSDNGCYADSDVFTVTVCVPKITTQPQSVAITEGETTRLTVAADLAGTTFKWYEGPRGDTSRQIGEGTFVDVHPTVATTYWARAIGCLTRDSEAATVSVCAKPKITQEPSDVNLPNGGLAATGVTATGTDLAYQWYEGVKGDTSKPLATKTEATLQIGPATTTSYWVRVSGRCGSADSKTIKVSVPPSISVHPVAGPITRGTTKQLSVTAGGTELSYQWYQRAATVTKLEGHTLPAYTPPAMTVDSTYFVRVHSGNLWRDSNDATFTICQPRTISVSGTFSGVAGSAANLKVDNPAAGETYEWYTGATGNTANRWHVGTTATDYPAASNSYWVRTKRSGCDADSAALVVTVCKPRIDAHPQSADVDPNQTRALSVTAFGPAPLTYQWYRGQSGDTSSPIGGATAASYTTVANAPTATYWVRVGAATGCAVNYSDSQAATVTLCSAPSISVQPANAPLPASGGTSLDVTASGTNLSFQWFEGQAGDTSKPVGNGTARSVTVQPPATTYYWVRVTGKCGTVNSTAARVSVRAAIQSHPAGGLVTKGQTRLLTVVATGNELSYRWYQRTASGAVLINNATVGSYTTPALHADATYFCRVRSGELDVDSNDAVLTVCQPRGVSAATYHNGVSESPVTLQVVSPGAGESYEWYAGPSGNTSSPLGGGTTKSLAPQVTTQYWVRTKRTGCDADSEAYTVTVCTPRIGNHPQGASVAQNVTHTMMVTATGTGPLSYQWYRGQSGDTSSPVVGANGASYTTVANTPTTAYWVRVSSPAAAACSSTHADSQAATVTACQPKIVTQPESYKMVRNSSRTLTVTASGDGLHYQWYEGLRGDTSRPVGNDQNTLEVYGSATRYFWVRVSNACGFEDSAGTVQSVYPSFTQQPVYPCGSSMTMYASANGADSYKWYRRYNNVTEEIGTGPRVTATVPGVPSEYWAEAISGEAVTLSDRIYVTTMKAAPALQSVTAEPWSTQWTISASVAAADRPYVRYKFYQGAQGDTSNLVVDQTTNYKTLTPPTRPIKYWVRVYFTTGGCFSDGEVTIP